MLAMDFGTNCVHGPWQGVCNQRRYSTIEPPEYELHKIDAPLALLSGTLLVGSSHQLGTLSRLICCSTASCSSVFLRL